MANKTQTYSTSDWKIWTYQPFNNRFILDFNQLDDASAPLSSTDGTIKTIDALIGGITITEGSSIDQGVFSNVQPASMTVSLLFKDFTAVDSRKFLVGSTIAASYRNAQTVENLMFGGLWGKTTPVFYGRISSFNVDIQPGSNFATVTIQANSYAQDNLNTQISFTKDTTTAKSALITSAANAKGIAIGLEASAYNYANTVSESKTLGEWLSDLIVCDMTLAANNFIYGWWGVHDYYYFYQNIQTLPSTVGTSSFTFDDTNITDVTLDWSGANAPTGVTLTNYATPATVYQYGTDSSSAGFNYSATIDVKDITQMTTIGQKMISMVKQFAPVSIRTKTATNFQNITFKEEDFGDGSVWFVPTNLIPVGKTIQVNQPTYGFTNQKMLITGRTIEVTTDNWTTTYDLWKGFTN